MMFTPVAVGVWHNEVPTPASAAVAVAEGAWEPSSVAKAKTARWDEPSFTEASPRVSDLLRLPTGPVDLKALATRATPGFTGAGKTDATTAMLHLGPRLADLQEQLYAEGHTGGRRSLLLVLQGMDTAGKGGTVKHVLGFLYPMGVQY